MLENYFQKGIRLKWNKPGDRGCPVDGASEVYRTAPSPMIYDGLDNTLINPAFNRNTPASIGLTSKKSIQYSWLDYAPGRTAKFKMGSKDVLTGLMSGCWLARWQAQDGIFVAHVGTINNKQADDRVKTTFSAEITGNMSVTAFKPSDAWGPNDQFPLIQEQVQGARQAGPAANQGRPGTFGLITTSGQFYSVFMFMVGNGEWVIGGCKAVAATGRAQFLNALNA